MSEEPGNVEEAYVRLQRGLLRVAFSFRGKDPEFDDHLKRLGRAIKTGAEPGALRDLIDKAISLIVAMAGPDEGRTALETLTRHLAIDDVEKKRLLAQIKDSEIGSDTLADAVARTVNAQLGRRPDEGQPSGTRMPRDVFDGLRELVPLLGISGDSAGEIVARIDLLARSSDTDYGMLERLLKEMARASATPLPHVDAGTPATEASSTPISDSDAAVAAECVEILNLLVERIPFPASVDKELGAIRHSLQALRDREELRAVTLKLADLISQMKTSAQRELSELGTFLKRITDDLLGLQTNLHRSSDAHAKSLEDSHQLEDEIGERVVQMRSECDESNDIDELRAVVSNHLAGIGDTLQSFVETQKSRHEDAEASLSELKDRVNELESEASELRKTLAAQQEQAIIDPLTRVPNRLGFEQQLGDEMARWERYHSHLSLAIIDIDHFKRINDGFGHAAGDKVLIAVARQIRDAVRRTDRVCRYGGEEFVVLLPETDLRAAFLALDKVRDLIANCQFQYKDERVPVTISVGVAQFDDTDTFDAVFERADAALYRAKESGRNQCVCDGVQPATVTALHG